MRIAPLVLIAFVAACSRETTPAGKVGASLNLRSHLAPDVLAHIPAGENAGRAELPVEVHGVKARLGWGTFADGPRRYILSAQWEVISPASGITLEPQGIIGAPVNAGTAEAPNEQMNIGVRWHDHNKSGTSFGDVVVTIRGDGTGSVP